MSYWIFQSIAERYDLRKKGVVEDGKHDTWYASRYRGRMKVGDIVYFWLGGIGEKRGVYALGEIISEPYRKDDWDSYGIDVCYKRKLIKPIDVIAVKNNEILSDLLILRAPQATNFALTEEQGKEFERIIAKEDK
ncbi:MULTISPECIES: EVE domain-containing protein [Halomonas]|uniref:EVE domain-containing protein n=1 Tax=Halomonas flagellata TaxID=2920385 RepID=A0ABS9RZX5_9GAMM|nr:MULTISPECIES: EVE domain-containing protein [Halomonas]MCH4565408.1 EVE domain-containing protein [Halomonas flagellata]PXX99277.1 hypothetical protein CR157_00310 [Halomonas sp. LBP4]